MLLAKTPDERAAIKQLMKQEKLFEAALGEAGREYAEKRFAEMKREAEKEANSQTSENLETDERDADSEQTSDTERTDGQKENASEGAVKHSLKGIAKDGKKIYEGNFAKGTPKAAKSERILEYIQNVWSKKPIELKIFNGEKSRIILANFDPTVDKTRKIPTDSSKLAGGNRHGNHTEQRVTLDLADDYYEIASESVYNYSKEETGKESEAHVDVKMWHYFVNDIYFSEYGSDELTPYTVTVNVKEKMMGILCIALMLNKRKSPPPVRLYMLP